MNEPFYLHQFFHVEVVCLQRQVSGVTSLIVAKFSSKAAKFSSNAAKFSSKAACLTNHAIHETVEGPEDVHFIALHHQHQGCQ